MENRTLGYPSRPTLAFGRKLLSDLAIVAILSILGNPLIPSYQAHASWYSAPARFPLVLIYPTISQDLSSLGAAADLSARAEWKIAKEEIESQSSSERVEALKAEISQRKNAAESAFHSESARVLDLNAMLLGLPALNEKLLKASAATVSLYGDEDSLDSPSQHIRHGGSSFEASLMMLELFSNFLLGIMPAEASSLTSTTISGSMDGNLTVPAGSTLRVGYDFTLPGSHPATNVFVTQGSVSMTVKCADGSTQALNVALPNSGTLVPLNNTGWFPSGDQTSSLTYQGQLTTPSNLCGGRGGSAPEGATFVAAFSTDTGAKVNVRFHYQDNTTGGGWSGTATAANNPLGSFSVSNLTPANGALLNTRTVALGATSSRVLSKATASVDGGAAQTLSVSADGLTISGAVTASNDGTHSIVVTAFDLASNTVQGSTSVSIDTVAPTVTLAADVPSLTNKTAANFTFTASEAATFSCSLDGAAAIPCTSPAGFTGLSSQAHTFSVSAKDAAGNTSTVASFSWTIDTTTPVVTLSANITPVTNQIAAQFTFSANKAATFSCSLDTASSASCTSPINYDQLSAGIHVFTVTALDGAGNSSAPATFAWSIVTTPPQFLSLSPQNNTYLNSRTVTISGTADEKLTGASANGTPLVIGSDGISFSGNLQFPADGPQQILVMISNGAGNATGKKLTLMLDTTAPAIAHDAPDGSYTKNQLLSFHVLVNDISPTVTTVFQNGTKIFTSPQQALTIPFSTVPLAQDGTVGAAPDRAPFNIDFGQAVSQVLTQPGRATAAINPDGTLAYTPNAQGLYNVSLLSATPEGTFDTGGNFLPSYFGGGSKVAFFSNAQDLLPGITNGTQNAFVYDVKAKSISRILTGSGAEPDGPTAPSNGSADGRYLLFYTAADNFDSGPNPNGQVQEAYLHDFQSNTNQLVFHAADGTRLNADVGEALLSSDGTRVVFTTQATNVLPSVNNGSDNVYLLDLPTNTIKNVSTALDGSAANGATDDVAISGNGKVIVMDSFATNMTSDALSGDYPSVFVRSDSGTIRLASVNNQGQPANNPSFFTGISDDGTLVTFISYADNLGAQPGTGAHLYIRDIVAGKTNEVKFTSDGSPLLAQDGSFFPNISYYALSPDARYFVLSTDAVNVGQYAGNGFLQCYFLDRMTGKVNLISNAADGTMGDRNCQFAAVAPDGQTAIVDSRALNLTDPGAPAPRLYLYLVTKNDPFQVQLTDGSTRAATVTEPVAGSVSNQVFRVDAVLAQGQNQFRIESTDVAGNIALPTLINSIYYDNVPLILTSLSVHDGDIVTTNPLQVTGTTNKPITQALIDGQPATISSDGLSFIGQAGFGSTAPWMVFVQINDAVGNQVFQGISVNYQPSNGGGTGQEPSECLSQYFSCAPAGNGGNAPNCLIDGNTSVCTISTFSGNSLPPECGSVANLVCQPYTGQTLAPNCLIDGSTAVCTNSTGGGTSGSTPLSLGAITPNANSTVEAQTFVISGSANITLQSVLADGQQLAVLPDGLHFSGSYTATASSGAITVNLVVTATDGQNVSLALPLQIVPPSPALVVTAPAAGSTIYGYVVPVSGTSTTALASVSIGDGSTVTLSPDGLSFSGLWLVSSLSGGLMVNGQFQNGQTATINVPLNIVNKPVDTATATFTASGRNNTLRIQGSLPQTNIQLTSTDRITLSVGQFETTIPVASMSQSQPPVGSGTVFSFIDANPSASGLTSLTIDTAAGVYSATLNRWDSHVLPNHVPIQLSDTSSAFKTCMMVNFNTQNPAQWSYQAVASSQPGIPGLSTAESCILTESPTLSPQAILTTDNTNVLFSAAVPSAVATSYGPLNIVQVDASLNQIGSTLCTLVDDGTNGDIKAGDGVYSCSVNFSNQPAGNQYFAIQGRNGVLSPWAAFSVLTPWSDDEAQAVVDNIGALGAIATSARAGSGSIQDIASTALASLMASDVVSDATIAPDSTVIRVTEKHGVTIALPIYFDPNNLTLGGGSSTTPSIGTVCSDIAPGLCTPVPVFEKNANYVVGNRVGIWNPTPADSSFQEIPPRAAITSVVASDSCPTLNLEDPDYSAGAANIGSFLNMDKYDIIVIATHGIGFEDGSGDLLTGQAVARDAVKTLQAGLDSTNSPLMVGFTFDDNDYKNPLFAVTNHFFEHLPIRLKNSVVVLEACEQFGVRQVLWDKGTPYYSKELPGGSIPRAFLKLGASVVAGFYGTVQNTDANTDLQWFFKNLVTNSETVPASVGNTDYAYRWMLGQGLTKDSDVRNTIDKTDVYGNAEFLILGQRPTDIALNGAPVGSLDIAQIRGQPKFSLFPLVTGQDISSASTNIQSSLPMSFTPDKALGPIQDPYNPNGGIILGYSDGPGGSSTPFGVVNTGCAPGMPYFLDSNQALDIATIPGTNNELVGVPTSSYGALFGQHISDQWSFLASPYLITSYDFTQPGIPPGGIQAYRLPLGYATIDSLGNIVPTGGRSPSSITVGMYSAQFVAGSDGQTYLGIDPHSINSAPTLAVSFNDVTSLDGVGIPGNLAVKVIDDCIYEWDNYTNPQPQKVTLTNPSTWAAMSWSIDGYFYGGGDGFWGSIPPGQSVTFYLRNNISYYYMPTDSNGTILPVGTVVHVSLPTVDHGVSKTLTAVSTYSVDGQVTIESLGVSCSGTPLNQ